MVVNGWLLLTANHRSQSAANNDPKSEINTFAKEYNLNPSSGYHSGLNDF